MRLFPRDENFLKIWEFSQMLRISQGCRIISSPQTSPKSWGFSEDLKFFLRDESSLNSSDFFWRAENFLKSWMFSEKLCIFPRVENFLRSSEFSQELRVVSRFDTCFKSWEFSQSLVIFSKVMYFPKGSEFSQELGNLSRAENFV